jgi:translation initiation factor IF-2
MESKKTKLTISGTAKKSIKNIEIAKTQGKNSVVIENPKNNFVKRTGSFRPAGTTTTTKPTSSFTRGAPFKPSFGLKTPPITNDLKEESLLNKELQKD